MRYEVTDKRGHVSCKLSSDKAGGICRCEMSVNKDIGLWNITFWFTMPEFMNKGFGKKALKHVLDYCMNTYGEPNFIRYTWNGKNAYVLKWLEDNFDAVCTCPIVVQKNQSDDDWDSHIYELDKDKVLKYFEIRKE